MEYYVVYTAKPLKRGWYVIYKNLIPLVRNKGRVYYSHPTKKRREQVMKTKSPKKILQSLGKRQKLYIQSP